jgi:hypothetical protein
MGILLEKAVANIVVPCDVLDVKVFVFLYQEVLVQKCSFSQDESCEHEALSSVRGNHRGVCPKVIFDEKQFYTGRTEPCI